MGVIGTMFAIKSFLIAVALCMIAKATDRRMDRLVVPENDINDSESSDVSEPPAGLPRLRRQPAVDHHHHPAQQQNEPPAQYPTPEEQRVEAERQRARAIHDRRRRPARPATVE